MMQIIFVEVESNLPENIKDRALSVFRSAVSEKYPIIAAIEKVQKEALCEIETVFKGQRFKVRLDYFFPQEKIHNKNLFLSGLHQV